MGSLYLREFLLSAPPGTRPDTLNHIAHQRPSNGMPQMNSINFKNFKASLILRSFRQAIVILLIALTAVAQVAPAFAATYLFTQTNWTGGASSTATVADPTNRVGWTQYQVASSSLIASTTLTLGISPLSIVQTDDGTSATGFNLSGSSFATTTIVGTGTGASVRLTTLPTGQGGTGADGNISISTTINISTTAVAGGRTCADAISYSVIALTTTTATLSSTPVAGCLKTEAANGTGNGDKLMLINEQGYGGNNSNVGNYEIVTAQSVSGNVVTFKTAKANHYGTTSGGDALFSPWKSLSSGGYATLAIKTDGTLWAWGQNTNGQLGLGYLTPNQQAQPMQVGAGTTWQSVSEGAYHSMAIKADGTLWAWGYNNYGQLGTGNTLATSSPIQVGVGTTW